MSLFIPRIGRLLNHILLKTIILHLNYCIMLHYGPGVDIQLMKTTF